MSAYHWQKWVLKLGKNSQFENMGKTQVVSQAEITQLAFIDVENSPIFRSIAATDDPRLKNADLGPIVKRGRPRGVKNRDNVRLAQLINARLGVDPYLAIADFCKLPIKQAAAMLQCSLLEAFKLQLQYTEKLGERIHGKAVQEVRAQIDNRFGAAVFNVFEFENEADALKAYRDAVGFDQSIETIEVFCGDTLEVTPNKVTDSAEGLPSDCYY